MIRCIREKIRCLPIFVCGETGKGFPLVEINMDRIVVTSCGGLVEGLTETDFFKSN